MMSSDDYFDDGPDAANLSQFQDQDLRVFKALTLNQKSALDFVNNGGSANLFLSSARPVGKLFVDYITTYKLPPTKRVLLDKCGKDKALIQQVNTVFDVLPDVEYDPSEFKYELDKLRQRFCDTQVRSLKDEFRFSNDNIDSEKLLAKLENTLKEVKLAKQSVKAAYNQKPIDEFLGEFHAAYLRKLEKPDETDGIKTGYSYLDYVTNGIQPSEMIIIGGETSSGKSMMLNNIATQMWMGKNTIHTPPDEFTKGANVLYFSLEMPYAACFRRTVSRIADVPMYSLRDATLTKSETESLNASFKFIKHFSQKNKFEIVDIPRGVSVAQIEERFLEACAKYTPDVVVVDYLGLLESGGPKGKDDAADWLRLGEVAGQLHEFTRSYNTRVFTAVQLNRVAKKNDASETIGVHRIGRSSLIMHHANVGIQIESRKDESNRDTFKYHIIKNRDGELGSHEISKKFKNAALIDVPYQAPDRDQFGSLISGFDEDEDISDQVKLILNNPKNL